MIAVSTVGYAWIATPDSALTRLAPDAVGAASVQGLSVVPLFILMGLVLERAGLGSDLYGLFDVLFRRLRGGLGVATIGASALFGAVNGSALASASTMSMVAVPEMRSRGYADKLAAGTAAVGGTLGMLIPPSATLVLYGLITEEPIGPLLVAGILPGIMTALLLMVTVLLWVWRRPEIAPLAIPEDGHRLGPALAAAWPVPVLFGTVMGGIYFGVFTPTEAGAAGAALSIVYGVLTRRVNAGRFFEAISRTVRLSAAIFLIVIGGKMFGFFLALSGIPRELSQLIDGLAVPSLVVIAAVYAVYWVLGALMDELAILVIMTPLVYPAVIALGYDGVWFGILTVVMLMSGLLAPPVGIVSFVVSSVTGINLGEVFRGIAPFMVSLAVAAALITLIPDIVLLLPRLM